MSWPRQTCTARCSSFETCTLHNVLLLETSYAGTLAGCTFNGKTLNDVLSEQASAGGSITANLRDCGVFRSAYFARNIK